MKILFLTRRFWPEIGGVEKHVLEVGKRLVEMGHEVEVVAEEAFSNLFTSQEAIRPPPRCFLSEGIRIYRIPITKNEKLKRFQIWKWLWSNRKLIQQADVVHAHDVGFWYWPFKLLKPLKPFYITFHGWEGKFPVPLKNKIVRKISEKIARGNICVGDYLEKWYGTKADYTTYGGVSFSSSPRPPASLREALRAGRSLRLAESRSEVFLSLIFIGRLEKDTGLPVYLKMIQRYKRSLNLRYKRSLNLLRRYKDMKIQGCEINFLGDGRLRSQAEKCGKVFGFVDNIKPHILKSRFVFTSGYLAILEAMIYKKLVFAVYDNPLKEDYLKKAPFARWMVIEADPKALMDKVKYYYQHPEEEKKLVDKAYHWAIRQSWEKVAKLYLKLYS